MKRNLKRIHFFGGGNLLVEAVKICLKQNYSVVVRTSRRLAKSGDQWCEQLRSQKIKIFKGNNLAALCQKGAKIQNGDVGFSFGAPWIFKKDWIKQWNGRLFNCHNRPLPEHRGAGGASWIILMGTKKGASTIHKITKGLDDGPIVCQKKYTYPKGLRLPVHFDKFDELQGKKFLQKNLPRLFAEQESEKKQTPGSATYWPRLSTALHGWINWSWPARDIKSFCEAFGDPYEGAKTLYNNRIIYIHDVEIIKKAEEKFHPFQTGLIFRKDKDSYLSIAHSDGTILVKKWIARQNIKPKIGDRLFTPIRYLERSFSSKVQYLPSGKLVLTQAQKVLV